MLKIVRPTRPTPAELTEFERLDATMPVDEQGHPTWSFEGEPLTGAERRWLELYRKLQGNTDAERAAR